MKIKINNTEVEAFEGEKLIEAIRRQGISIPSLCYSPTHKHQASCMVCVVKDCRSNQMIPSCSTFVAEGMEIDTDSEEVENLQQTSLELLLSDHRADCEAPCSIVCPGGLDIAKMNRFYDKGQYAEAVSLLRDTLVIPATLCYICPAPCEKICRKGEIDIHVKIREIKKDLVKRNGLNHTEKFSKNGKKIAILGSCPAALATAYRLCKTGYSVTIYEKSESILPNYTNSDIIPHEILELEIAILKKMGIEIFLSSNESLYSGYEKVISEFPDSKQPARLISEGFKIADGINSELNNIKRGENSKLFNSSFGKFNTSEKEALKESFDIGKSSSGCLYCDCDKKSNCRLRDFSTQYQIRKSKDSVNAGAKALERIHLKGNIWFEPAKCIKCGLCVYNSKDGFTFKNRGFGMQIVIPDESVKNINESLSELCPTGAIYLRT